MTKKINLNGRKLYDSRKKNKENSIQNFRIIREMLRKNNRLIIIPISYGGKEIERLIACLSNK
jgi:hypothetical protein